jgi:hypothetical protein
MSDRRRAKASSNANKRNGSRKSNQKLFVNDTIDELRKELGMIDKTIAALIRLAALRERS